MGIWILVHFPRLVSLPYKLTQAPLESGLSNLAGNCPFTLQTSLVGFECGVSTGLDAGTASQCLFHREYPPPSLPPPLHFLLTNDCMKTYQLCDSGVLWLPQKALWQCGHSPTIFNAAEGHCVGLAVISGLASVGVEPDSSGLGMEGML